MKRIAFYIICTALFASELALSQEWMQIPGTMVHPEELVANMGQPFRVIKKRMVSRESSYRENGLDGVKVIRFKYISTQPLSRKTEKKSYFKFLLTVTRFKEQSQAEYQFRSMEQKAHPDMGLSYEWDLLFVKQNLLYHLNAPCTVSEATFNDLGITLVKMVHHGKGTDFLSMSCRCGGGCKKR